MRPLLILTLFASSALADEPRFESELCLPAAPASTTTPRASSSAPMAICSCRGIAAAASARPMMSRSAVRARRPAAKQWSDAFLMADTPGFPDCNTDDVDRQGRQALAVLAGHPGELVGIVPDALPRVVGLPESRRAEVGMAGDHPAQAEGLRGGDAPRVRGRGRSRSRMPTKLSRSTLNDDFGKKRIGTSCSRGSAGSRGASRRCSQPAASSCRFTRTPIPPGSWRSATTAARPGPRRNHSRASAASSRAVLERKDGTLVAYMRENGLFNKIRVAESKDRGVYLGHGRQRSTCPTPAPASTPCGSRAATGCSFTTTRCGAATASRCRCRTTRGRPGNGRGTWRSTTAGSYHYPAVIQAKDGAIHAVYSYFVKDGKSMKHAASTRRG